MKKPSMSIHSLIFILVSSIAAIIITIQFVCVGILFNIFNSQKNAAVSSMVSQTVQIMEDNLQTIDSIQNYTTNSNDISQFLYDSSHNKENSLYLKISDETMALNRFFTDRISLILADNNGKFYNFFNSTAQAERDKVSELYTEYIKGASNEERVLFTLPNVSEYELYICSFSPITKIERNTVSSSCVGNAIILNRLNIYKVLRDMEYLENGELIFKNSSDNKTLLFSKNPSEDKSAVSKTRKIPDTNWRLTGNLIYESQTSAVYKIILLIIIELVIIILLIYPIQLFILNRCISAPVKKFLKFFDTYSINAPYKRLDGAALSEFHQLSNHINTMLDKSEEISRKIVHTQQKLYESELCEKEAVLYALQMQINPHFLYNTLECIGGLAISYNAYEITEMMDSLSSLLRYALSRSSQSTVEDEIKALEAYMKIFRIRYPDRFSYTLDFDDDIWECNILRMLFQPIAENAIKHGFLGSKEKGKLDIKGFRDKNNLVFRFYDNGVGIKEEKLKEIKARIENCNNNLYTSNSVGIVNIHKRIRLNYGELYGVQIESIYGEYTLVTITIPMQ